MVLHALFVTDFSFIRKFECPRFWEHAPSIAFYYNRIDSVRELMNYDRVVVNPTLITPEQTATLQTSGTLVFAYLSVGEYGGTKLPDSLQSASPIKNGNWNSHVMDLSSPSWRNYLFSQVRSLTNQHFDGLFLDTLDSYTLLSQNGYDLPTQKVL